MTDPTVLWPTVLGLAFLVAGIVSYRRDLARTPPGGVMRLSVLGPVFIASALAAFAGEHFTAAGGLVGMVPKWLPAPMFITYLVGVAHLSAALSLTARRFVRWSGFFLGVMFALFVLTLYLPSAMRHPTLRIVWIFPFREGSFAVGGAAIFAVAARDRWPSVSRGIAAFTRIWGAITLVFFGVLHLLYPRFAPGVPGSALTSAWVPAPQALAYLTGMLLTACGIAMLARKHAAAGATLAGLLMLMVAVCLNAPEYFIARNVTERVAAYNTVFDTMLFAGAMFVIANAISAWEPNPAGDRAAADAAR